MLDYLSLATSCVTQNEVNRLHIDLDNRLSPLEVAGIANLAVTPGLPKFSTAWLAGIEKLHPEVLKNPQQFWRYEISPFVNFYQDPYRALHEKSLLIGFSGNARRLMLPASIVLQSLEPCCWDVLILRKCARNSYLRGIEEIATDLAGLLEHVLKCVPSKRYRRIVTLGTSGGGYAAAWAAILANAERGICVGGSMPQFSTEAAGSNPPLYQPSVTPHTVDLEFIYGGDFLRDRQSGLALQQLFGGRLHPVSGIDQHGVLKVLLERGELSRFFKEVLG